MSKQFWLFALPIVIAFSGSPTIAAPVSKSTSAKATTTLRLHAKSNEQKANARAITKSEQGLPSHTTSAKNRAEPAKANLPQWIPPPGVCRDALGRTVRC
jgi:hypothetical protein